MDGQDFGQRQEKILEHLPKEFQSYVSSTAYDRGHSGGYEEVLNIAEGMAYDLIPVIKSYTERILKEKT